MNPSQSTDRLPALLPLLALYLLVIVSPWFDGGDSWQAETLLFTLTLPVFYFTWRDHQDELLNAVKNPLSLIFLALAAWSFLSLIVSTDRFSTFEACLRYTSFYLLYVSVVGARDERLTNALANAAIISALILSALGLYEFISAPNFSYTHLFPSFYQKNAFGGFLLLPLLLSYAYISLTSRPWLRNIYIASTIFLGAIFVLTFSRGSWVSLLAGILVAGFFYRATLFKILKDTWRTQVLLIVGITVLACAALYTEHLQAASKGEAIAVWSGETSDENTVTARLHYFKDALNVIANNALIGVGLAHYGEAVKLYKDTPAYYSSTPHNTYLQFGAETGIVGGILFTLFILLTLFEALKRSRDTNSIYFFALSAGFIAIALHSAMEVDWTYEANALLYVLAAALLTRPTAVKQAQGKWSFMTLTSFALLLLVWGALSSYSGFWSDRGYNDAAAQNFESAAGDFLNASKPLGWDPTPHFNAAVILINLAGTSTEPQIKHGYLAASLMELDKAIASKPQKPLLLSWRALILQNLGDADGERKALEDTVRYNPVEGIFEYEKLAIIYNKNKEYDKVIAIVPRATSYYPLELYPNPYWVNPDKLGVWASVSNLYTELGYAYLGTNDRTKAHDAFKTALSYDPQNIKAKALEKVSK